MPISTTPLPIGMTSPPSTRRGAEGLVGIAPPDLEVAALEARVELVDRALQQRLGLARRPEHRIAGHAAVDPAGRVALEQRVGHRRERGSRCRRRPRSSIVDHSLFGTSRIAMPPIRCSASFAAGISSSQGRMTRPTPRPTSLTVMRRSSTQARASLSSQRLGQHLVQVEHLGAALAHLEHEVVVVLLRFLHPEHVVEQQIGGVARASAADGPGPGRQTITVLQLADFAVNSEFLHACRPPDRLFSPAARPAGRRRARASSELSEPLRRTRRRTSLGAEQPAQGSGPPARRKSSSPRRIASATVSLREQPVEHLQVAPPPRCA